MRTFGFATMALLLFVGAACGSDSDGSSADSTAAAGAGADEAQNACPSDGCVITITDVAAEGEELLVTWDANFAPDVSKNHVHIYWDTFSADQVSGDAADRGVTQGEWVPTGDNPTFVTEGAVSTSVAGTSTTLCVTASDRDHNVLDSSIVNCFDVSSLLS